MKKLICVFVLLLMLFALGGCSNAGIKYEGLPYPPVREGRIHAKVDPEKSYTLETAFDEAETVAIIKVGDWLSETNDELSTFFAATVVECLKGRMPENFVLKQDGSSEMLAGCHLFTRDNELLVFLKKAPNGDYKNVYWIIGSFSTFMDVGYDNAGNRYFCDRYGQLGVSSGIMTNYILQSDIYSEIYSGLAQKDSVIESIGKTHAYQYVFSDSDVMELLVKD